MNIEERILELEKTVAVLEYQMQEQRDSMKQIKSGLDTLEKMLLQIKENPFGLES